MIQSGSRPGSGARDQTQQGPCRNSKKYALSQDFLAAREGTKTLVLRALLKAQPQLPLQLFSPDRFGLLGWLWAAPRRWERSRLPPSSSLS